jgi:hypothetical protein
MTPDEFLQKQPQFRKAGEAIISAALARAAEQYDPTACGKFYEQIVEYTACDLIASGAYGQVLPQPLPKNQRNIYKDIVDGLVMKIPRRGIVL